MKLHLGYLLGLSAIIVAACAAFFSVYGLSQLFAGASLAVIVMATALEVSKIIAASFLHRYWDEISKILRTYLTIGVVVLITITSAGIYGFLTNAYQKTANNLMIHEGEVGLLDNKIDIFKRKIANNNGLVENKYKRITQLSDIRTGQEVRLDTMLNRKYFINANDTRDEITQANKEIQILTNDVESIIVDNNILNDSINKYEIQKLEMVSNSDVSAEVGPLRYMAELTGKPMDNIVNYFVLLLVFVFDPMAISLVIATGWVFQRERKKSEENKNEPKPAKIEKKVTPKKPVEEEVVEEEDIEEEVVEIKEEPNVKDIASEEENNVEEEIKEEPKPIINVEDSNEVRNKEKKFSVEIPKANNTVERIGSNKFLENKKTVVYRKKRND